MSPLLRPARSTDAGSLGEMITRAVEARDWKPVLHSAAEDIAHAGTMIERGWVTVAEDGPGAVVGFLAREGSYVHALFVAPGAQGRGVGRTLLEDAQRRAARLELWTFVANARARRFYERAGFAVTRRGDGSANEEGLPDLFYVWEAPDIGSVPRSMEARA
ncbi:GNAT family N-acetyltransferase [Alloyangia pacifica]|uniref:L-amino acid N-acyltransferase YncA n=1 Tax=Alloyangia pacifica TaxID=311180 RepID=A0A1I6W2P8_9RHOB|nr:GNAT family N-acetyltransferase [Alloyangia pacifica]SDI39914.1 L-amino acid N-acyltransferase YncA [Alloyangia pacifica]SFT20277.1 L-amino acid N-acyltransferase YncA [Alloyangia pacifica]